MSKPKSHARLSRIMQNLRPGDVITNLDCPVHQHFRILVLASRGGRWFDFAQKVSGELQIILDKRGPWRWDDEVESFVNKDGDEYGEIGPETIVLEGAGIEQVQWYRELPAAEADRWFINPHHMIGTFNEPGTMAKMEALLARHRGAEDVQQIRNVSHVLELIFAGTGALDARRMRLTHVLINSLVNIALRESQGRRRQSSGVPPELADLADLFGPDVTFMGADDFADMPGGLGAMLAAALSGLTGRDGGARRGPRSRGNGRDHDHPVGAGGMPG